MATNTGESGGPARRFLSAHRRAVVIATSVAAALLIFVMVWFQPQKLFIEKTVDEVLPGRAPAAEQDAPAAAPETTSIEVTEDNAKESREVLAAGDFRGLEHGTTGRALVLELDGDSRFLRFEDLDTSNGPDLRVYLSEVPASDNWYAYGERFIDLGPLKGNRGNQNYRLPDDLDLSRYKSAVIWCRRFTVGFGVAPLTRST